MCFSLHPDPSARQDVGHGLHQQVCVCVCDVPHLISIATGMALISSFTSKEMAL